VTHDETTPAPSDIGIVVVTHNSEAAIGSCLDAAVASGAELVVVDNASADHTLERVRQRPVRVIANAQNRGFAAAVNQGVTALERDFVLLLNPDAVLASRLDSMRAACSLPGAAGCGGLLIGEDGHPQTGFMVRRFPSPAALILEALLLNRLWPGNPVNRRYRALDLDYTRRLPVEQPAGAFLMIRRAAWQELGGFEESFFPLWFEDVDFCRRAADRGYVLYFEPTAVAKHTGAHSIFNLTLELRRIYWYRSLLAYAFRHFRPATFRAVCLAVAAGCVPRMIVDFILERRPRLLRAYVEVVRLAGRSLVFGWRD